MSMFKLNDKVIATFSNSGLSLGGTIIMVIVVNGKPVQYCVQFSTESHHMFEELNVRAA